MRKKSCDIMSEDCDCEICREGVKCGKCGAKMEGGKFRKGKGGSEAREIRCPKCGKRSMEVKMPYDAFGADEAGIREDLAMGIFNSEKFR